MKSQLQFLILLSLLLLARATVHAQYIQTIDYSAWSGSTNCNIFPVENSVNGKLHLTVIGQPRFYNANGNKYVTLDASNNSTQSDSKGTEYRISNQFKAGHAYTIKINAASIGTAATAMLRTNLASSTLSYPQCTGVGVINPATTGNMMISQYINLSFSDYYFQYAPLSADHNYLLVAAIQPYGNTYQTIAIRSITITETQADLVLSPSTLPATCGASLSQTFTLTNPFNVQGITSYVWSAGSGWRYNGNPVPATITTTTPSLALTTNCLSANPGNVSVSVYRGAQLFKTYTAAVNYNGNAPAITIDGPEAFCRTITTPKVYTASSYWSCPPGVTYTWSKSSNLTLTGSGSSVSVLPVAGQTGAAWVEVTASSNCGTSTIRKHLQIDIMPSVSGGSHYTESPPNGGPLVFGGAPNLVCGIMQYTHVTLDLVGVTSKRTTYEAPPPGVTWGPTTPNGFYFDWLEPGSSVTFTSILENSCGVVPVVMHFEHFCFEESPANSGAFIAYPNPATTYLLVAPNPENKSAVLTETFSIGLYNEKGTRVRSLHNADGGSHINIPIGNLPQGTYYLHIQQGKKLYKKQISVKK